MKKRTSIVLVFLLPFMFGFGKCGEEALTSSEALQSLEEVVLSTQMTVLTSGSVEIATNFTIGQAAQAAAEELGIFIETQMPCAEITLVDATLTIEYGVNPGNCEYNGQEYSGSHSITVVSASVGNLVVDHEWEDLSNGRISVTGDATVTWSSEDSSRNVVHELVWTRIIDGKVTTGGGDRTQTVLNGSLFNGFTSDGNRYWNSDRGDWDLDIDNVEIRWEDPVPQAGTYTLDTPFDKSASLSFERLDDDTIEVTIASGEEEFSFEVSKLGTVSDSD